MKNATLDKLYERAQSGAKGGRLCLYTIIDRQYWKVDFYGTMRLKKEKFQGNYQHE